MFSHSLFKAAQGAITAFVCGLIAFGAPNASGANPACSSEEVFQMEVQDSYPYVTSLERLSLISKSPLKIVRTQGQSYGIDIDTGQEGTNIKGVKKRAGQVEWFDGLPYTYDKSVIDGYATYLAKEIASYSTCNSPMCQGKRKAYEKQLAWVKCHAGSKSSERPQNIDAELDTVTPQVRGCPKYLRKSLVVWRQVGNPQLNTWEIRNVSGKTLSVTYMDSDGVNGDTNGLGPGSTSSVSLVSRVIPPYVVRDFDELFAFNKTPAARAGKTLKCQLAIRPR